MHDDASINHLSNRAQPIHLVSKRGIRQLKTQGANIRNDQAQHDVQRARASHSRARDAVEQEPDDPDQRLDASGDEVEDGAKAAGGEQADFDEREDDAEAREGENDTAGSAVWGSVSGLGSWEIGG